MILGMLQTLTTRLDQLERKVTFAEESRGRLEKAEANSDRSREGPIVCRRCKKEGRLCCLPWSFQETGKLTTRGVLWKMVENSGEVLDSLQQQELYTFLLGFADVFAFTDAELGRTDRLQHTITTETSYPIRSPARRIPAVHKEEVHRTCSHAMSFSHPQALGPLQLSSLGRKMARPDL